MQKHLLFRGAPVVAALTLVAAVSAESYKITPIVLEGDAIPGVGLTVSVTAVDINDAGEWLVEVDTDALADFDLVLIRPGNPYTVFLREGDPLAVPAGATISSFGSVRVNIDDNGDSAVYMTLDGLTSSTDSGVFLNTQLLIQESDVATAPQFSPNTPYIGFFGALSSGNGQIMAMSSIDDAAINSTVDRAIVIIDTATGQQTVLIKEGDAAAGSTIADFGTARDTFAFNAGGSVLYVVDTVAASNDGAIYLDNAPVALEGQPSPITGRNWATLSNSTNVDLNDNGGYAHRGTLDGDAATNLVLVSSAGKVAQEGDAVPGLPAFLLTGFGSVGPKIDNLGNVFWYGDWDDANTTIDTGLFRNSRLIVQEGVTTINGVILAEVGGVADTFGGITNGFDASSNGRHIVMRGRLDDGRRGAFHITVCIEDVSGDGVIDQSDLNLLLAAFGTCAAGAGFNPDADLDNSGCIDQSDLNLLLAAFGASCP